jgi:hypothetical protein
LALKAYLVGTSSWTITEYTEFGPVDSTVEEAGGPGLKLSYAMHPNFALFAAADLNLYGDLSAYSILAVGAEYRLPIMGRFVAAVSGGIGRYTESDQVLFNVGVFDGGIEFFIFRRLALDAGLQVLTALGDGRHEGRFETTRVKLDSTIRRKRLGLSWYLGRR